MKHLVFDALFRKLKAILGVSDANGTEFVIRTRPTFVPTGPGARIEPFPAPTAPGAEKRS